MAIPWVGVKIHRALAERPCCACVCGLLRVVGPAAAAAGCYMAWSYCCCWCAVVLAPPAVLAPLAAVHD